MRKDIEAVLKLHKTKGVGLARLKTLHSHFGDINNVFSASQSELKKTGLPENVIQNIRDSHYIDIDSDLKWLESEENHLIIYGDENYPHKLLEIEAAPFVIFARGNIDLLKNPQIAMVGSRNPTRAGKESAYEFAKSLSHSGITVTSGLALGIDGASHLGALEGIGGTVAVTATGLDRIYPAKHKDLGYKIIESGVIISEFPLGTSPIAENFPRRNRIISGLSLGTLVVEAALKSGSLITAKYAYEQNREVFAIPGSINNPLSKGCHSLIKQGAKLVETAEDIIIEIGSLIKSPYQSHSSNTSVDSPSSKPALSKTAQSKTALSKTALSKIRAHSKSEKKDKNSSVNTTLSEIESKLLNVFEYDPLSIDDIAENTNFSAAEICSTLTILEVKGFISSSPGGLYNKVQ